jgi:iron(III) transport system ATP-binding protein
MATSSFLDVRHVYVDYAPPGGILRRLAGAAAAPRSVLRDITFQLQAGQHVALFGTPGAGKSTLLRALTGALSPARGHIIINGKTPRQVPGLSSGYVSIEESEPGKETAERLLHTFASTHKVGSAPARISVAAEALGIQSLLTRTMETLSTTEHLRVNLAKAAIGPAPAIFLDDVTDQLGSKEMASLIPKLYPGRTVIVATRSAHDAQQLGLPIIILHKGELAHFGTCDDIVSSTTCPRVVRAWVEGMRYDLLRALKKRPGVTEVRLLPSDQFDGQQLRIVVRSSRYLPALYDLISQADLLRIDEEPVSLEEIVENLG